MSDGQVRAQVLVVDDEKDHAEAMAEALRKPGHVCTIVHSLAAAREEIRHGHFDVIVTDLVMETETAGLDVLALARTEQPHAETIMVTAHGDIPTAKKAICSRMLGALGFPRMLLRNPQSVACTEM